MEMPSETKTKTRARAQAQALFKTATGNGNSYTRNINTVKNDTKFQKILPAKQSSAEKQHNKTKIKIKTNRSHHLKCLINLYFKLILCLNHLKKIILKTFNIKSSYTNNNSENCIIYLQQNEKQKEKAIYLPRISFKIFINFLTSFHYCRRKNRINYVQLTIRHFVGICLKRLISLMRLQQIPESSKINKNFPKYGHMMEKLKQNKAKFKKSLKTVLRWREKAQKEALKYKYFQQLLSGEDKDKLPKSEQKYSKITQDVYKGSRLINQSLRDVEIQESHEKCQELTVQKVLPEMYKQNHTELKNTSEEQIEKTCKLKLEATSNNYGQSIKILSPKHNFSKECSQLYVINNNGKAKSNMIPTVQNYISKNKRFLRKILSKFHKKYAHLRDGFIHGTMKGYSIKNFTVSQKEHKDDENLKSLKLLENFQYLTFFKYYQLKKCHNTFEHNCRKKYGNIFILKLAILREKNNKTLQKYENFQLKNFVKEVLCWQLKPSRDLLQREIQEMWFFHTELLIKSKDNHKQTLHFQRSVEQQYSPNSPIHQIHLFKPNNGGVLIFHAKLPENMKILKLNNNKEHQFATYSPLQQMQIKYYRQYLTFNLKANFYFSIDLRTKFHAFLRKELSKLPIRAEKYQHKFLLNSPRKCCQLSNKTKFGIFKKFGPNLLGSFKAKEKILKIPDKKKILEEFSSNSPPVKCAQQTSAIFVLKHDLAKCVQMETILKENFKYFAKLNYAKIKNSKTNAGLWLENIVSLNIINQRDQKLKEVKTNLSQFKQTYFNLPPQNRGHFKQNDQLTKSKDLNFLLAEQKNNETASIITYKQSAFNQNQQPNSNQKFYIENGLQKKSTLHSINGGVEEDETSIKLGFQSNTVRHFLLDDNNNSYQVKSKHQEFLRKCQHILFAILLSCYCNFCYWHINGFPLVLVKIFKYLKDATVHVLTRRLKIAVTTAITEIATSICYYYSMHETACDGKLKKLTILPDDKANQQNSLKRQQSHIMATKTTATITTTTLMSCGTYSSSCCSTTSLTASSSYCKSLKNLILLKKLAQTQAQDQQQQQQQCSSHCRYQQYRPHHHYHYKYNQQKHEQTQQQQQQQRQQQQLYNSNTTIQLQLPSLLVFSRTLIILILLSSLWHTSEGFHGSTVKLSTNTVKTKYGLVRGIVVRSSPSLVEAYLGIPYASPPVGSLRFMPPITPSTWKNVRNADRFSPVCPQNVPIPPNGPEALLEVPRARLAQLRRLLPLLSNQSEDCLYLNIYVPYEYRRHRRSFTTTSGEYKDTPKLATILFIHGESYEWNSGNPYDGSELAAHGNVVVVTINFRLGILGFLKTGGKESAQGNFGLMDLVAGLHWLKENLPAFGGDPQQITLLGHGTGAALANILVVSPVASDLIQHTVMVSGSALSPWAIQKNPLFVKRRVAEQTGCHGDMLYDDLAPCLRTKSVTELLAVKIDHPRFLVGFAPFIDGTVISPNTDDIGKLSLPLGSAIVSTSGIEFANFPKRNFMFCLTSVESHLDLNAQDLEFGFNETRRDRILRTYVRNNFHYHLNEIFAVLKNEYTDWDQAIRSPLSSRDATLQFLSDGHTASSLIKLGYMHSLRGGKGYFLHFKHRTVEEEYPQRTGSVRGEDVPFWLGLPISPLFPHNYTTQEKQISLLMLRYLANFAKTGNPNQSSLSLSLPSASSLIGSAVLSSSSSFSSSSSSLSSPTANDLPTKFQRNSSFNIVNATTLTSSGPNKSQHIIEDVATAAAREALHLAVLYNQRRTKRTYYKRHSRSNNDDHSGSASSEVNYFINNNDKSFSKLDSGVLPFWDAYDVVNQLYMELSNKAEIQSHYRGHKLSMWLNLIPQLHRHANMNDQSMRHHQFQDDLNNLNLYEGIVRAQIQTKPDDDDETLLLPRGKPTLPASDQEANATPKSQGGTTECGVDGAMFVAEMTTIPAPTENRSLVLDSREKEMATASTGIISNLEILRRLSGKQFPSYATALIATVAVGCFLFILNILIFAGIYHQREKRAKDAKTKEELQDNDTSKNSSMLKLNTLGSETGSFNGSGAGVSGKTTVVFGEYSCYDEKSLPTKDEKLIVELPPKQMVDANWAGCSTSTLDLLKTKHHTPLDNTYALGNIVPINTESQTEHLMEMATYNPLPMTTGLIIDPAFAANSNSGLLGKRGSFVGSSGQLNQYDFASVQSSDQMSFKAIENAVKVSATMNDDITQDDDIPEPPPPPRSFQSMQQQQQQAAAANPPATASGSCGGGILRQAGTSSASQTGGGKKRVHIQEISV